ncbi:phage portal protein [Neisseria sp. S1]|uniref:phage portal protein n=1 Tax=Neisseria sp. S1 TaxID=3318354 RepID=UPI003A89662F
MVPAARLIWIGTKMDDKKVNTISTDADFFSAAELVGHSALMDAIQCHDNGKYFEPPVNQHDLVRLLGVGVHHQSALSAKLNILTSTFKPTAFLSRSEFKKFAFNYLVLGNGYLEAQVNRLGKVLAVKNRLALYMRRASNLRDYVYIRDNGHLDEISGVNIAHLMQPDLRQEVYGLPHYLSALNSIELNNGATMFRRRYYENGSHAGFIFYTTEAQMNESDWENLKQQMRSAKGAGNFKNLYLRSPNGNPDGIKLIPIADVAAKDEFLNIKSISADDMLAIHRVPPKLMGIVPKNAGSLGDGITDARVFAANEIAPIQRDMESVNDMFGLQVISFDDYTIERGDSA